MTGTVMPMASGPGSIGLMATRRGGNRAGRKVVIRFLIGHKFRGPKGSQGIVNGSVPRLKCLCSGRVLETRSVAPLGSLRNPFPGHRRQDACATR
jgi:hypothetical protein